MVILWSSYGDPMVRVLFESNFGVVPGLFGSVLGLYGVVQDIQKIHKKMFCF